MKTIIVKVFSLVLLLSVLLLPSVTYAASIDGKCVDGTAPISGKCTGAKRAISDVCVTPSSGIVKIDLTFDADAEYTQADCDLNNAGKFVKTGTSFTVAATGGGSTCPNGTPRPTNGICPVVGGGGGGGGGVPGSTVVTCSGGSNDAFCIPENPACVNGSTNSIACSGNANITGLLAQIINTMLFFAGIIAVVFIIIGGYRYMTSAGSEDGAKKGRATLTNAIIGLIIVILAYVIVRVIVNFLTK